MNSGVNMKKNIYKISAIIIAALFAVSCSKPAETPPASSETEFDFAACIPRGALLRHECALEQGRAGIQLHLHRAGAALAQAKELHDELESFYVPNMDFAKWQTILDRTLESLK